MMITAALPFKASKDEAFVIEHRPKRSFGLRGASESFSFGPFPFTHLASDFLDRPICFASWTATRAVSESYPVSATLESNFSSHFTCTQ